MPLTGFGEFANHIQRTTIWYRWDAWHAQDLLPRANCGYLDQALTMECG